MFSEIDVYLDQSVFAKQSMNLCANHTGIRLTTFEHAMTGYEHDMRIFLTNINLDAIQWVNIARGQLSFVTID